MSAVILARGFSPRCTKPIIRCIPRRRCWSATAHVASDDRPVEGDVHPGASRGGMQESVAPNGMTDSHHSHMEVFREFRSVARGFRWPNHDAVGNDSDSVDEVAAAKGGDAIGDSGADFADEFNDGIHAEDTTPGHGNLESETGFTDDDLFGEDGERLPFHDLMAMAESESGGADATDDETLLKGRRTFGRVIRKDISERDVLTLSMFVNELGRIQPRHVTGLSPKQQRKVAKMVKRARHMGIMPHMFRLPPQFAFTSPLHNMADIERVESWNDARSSKK